MQDPSLTPMPPQENVVAPSSSSHAGRTALIALLVAIIFGLGGAAGAYFYLSPQLKDAQRAAANLDGNLTMARADLAAAQAAVAQLTAKVSESNRPKIGDHAVGVRKNEAGFAVVEDGLEVANIVTQNDGRTYTAIVRRVTASYAYMDVCVAIDGDSDVPFSDTCVFGTYRLDLASHELVLLDLPQGTLLQDISPGESRILYADQKARQMVVKDLLTDTEQRFDVPEGLASFGQGVFSPDGTRFAYAGTDQGLDLVVRESAAFIVTLSDGAQQEVKRAEGTEVRVRYWSSNEFVVVQ